MASHRIVGGFRGTNYPAAQRTNPVCPSYRDWNALLVSNLTVHFGAVAAAFSMLSSSTSNIRVAFGPMTWPAPCSP
jgi:hypothetical protein